MTCYIFLKGEAESRIFIDGTADGGLRGDEEGGGVWHKGGESLALRLKDLALKSRLAGKRVDRRTSTDASHVRSFELIKKKKPQRREGGPVFRGGTMEGEKVPSSIKESPKRQRKRGGD